MLRPAQARIRESLSMLFAGALLAGSAGAQELQTELVLSASEPTWVGSPPGDDRIFVLEQNQADVEVFDANGAYLGKFLDLSGKVVSGGERGLLSLAFHPDFETNGHVFVYFDNTGVSTRIERYTVTPPSGGAADPASATLIIEQQQPTSNHRGGNLQFGDDGLLYFAFGNGGGGGWCNAQDGDTLLGKMIRIDVDTDDFPGDPQRNYGIPPSNPFLSDPTILDEIYHLGLRNPWRWAFDPANGDMYVSDVGGDFEEVHYVPSGASGVNFGWPVKTGSLCFGPGTCPATSPACASLADPIHEYAHGDFGAPPCAVIGGLVYRGNGIPGLDGTYFFGDFCAGDVWSFRYDPVLGVQELTDRTVELDPPGPQTFDTVRSFGYDGDGEILIADKSSIFRIVKVAGLEADVPTFSVSGGGTQTLSLTSSSDFSGDLYVLTGSITGTSGITFGMVTIPLTFDGYTLHTLLNPNLPPLLNNVANLDGSGAATASFTAGPAELPASLVGLTAYHAFAVFDPIFPAAASNFTTIEFLP